VRTRLIVAIAALMAASALVALPEPAGSSAPSSARSVDPALLSAVSIALPAGSAATAIPSNDTAWHSAGRLEARSMLVEPGRTVVTPTRPAVDQPGPRIGEYVKNYWRHDPRPAVRPGFIGSGHRLRTDLHRTSGVAPDAPCGTWSSSQTPNGDRHRP